MLRTMFLSWADVPLQDVVYRCPHPLWPQRQLRNTLNFFAVGMNRGV